MWGCINWGHCPILEICRVISTIFPFNPVPWSMKIFSGFLKNDCESHICNDGNHIFSCCPIHGTFTGTKNMALAPGLPVLTWKYLLLLMNWKDLPEVTCCYNLPWQHSALGFGDRAVPGSFCALTVSREVDCLDAVQNITLAFYINNIILIKNDKQKEAKYLRHT